MKFRSLKIIGLSDPGDPFYLYHSVYVKTPASSSQSSSLLPTFISVSALAPGQYNCYKPSFIQSLLTWCLE